MAVEWVGFARVNTVSPGYIATEMLSTAPQATKDIWKLKNPMGREGEPNELKGAYLYLASDASSYTTGAGKTMLSLLDFGNPADNPFLPKDIRVDGGYCLP